MAINEMLWCGHKFGLQSCYVAVHFKYLFFKVGYCFYKTVSLFMSFSLTKRAIKGVIMFEAQRRLECEMVVPRITSSPSAVYLHWRVSSERRICSLYGSCRCLLAVLGMSRSLKRRWSLSGRLIWISSPPPLCLSYLCFPEVVVAYCFAVDFVEIVKFCSTYYIYYRGGNVRSRGNLLGRSAKYLHLHPANRVIAICLKMN